MDESGKIPNFMGMKFTNEVIADFNAIGHYKNKKYNMLFGRDEILTSALATGVADGHIGSLVNFSSYNIDVDIAWKEEDIETAQRYQLKTLLVIEEW